MSLMNILWFAGALAVAAAVPGPATMTTIGRVLARGRAGALAFALGLLLGDLLFLWAASLGLGAAATVVGATIRWGKLAGAAYLLVLAWKMWRTEPVALAETNRFDRRAVLSGFVLQLGNPKVLLFYAALVPAIVPIGALTLVSLSILSAVVACVLLAINLLYVECAAHARRYLRSPRALRTICRVNALVLAATAVAISLSTL